MILPDTVKNIAVGKNTNVHVGHQNVVKTAFFLITEKRVWHPHLLGVRHGEVLDFFCNLYSSFEAYFIVQKW